MNVYLDNGATTKTDKDVIKAMLPYFTKDYGNPSSLHTPGQKTKIALDNSRKIFAQYINASPEEIIFTSGGTESDNLAIKGIVRYYKSVNKSNNNSEKIHIITSKIEHPAVLNVCKQLERENVEVTYIDVDTEGRVILDQLKNAIKSNTKLITIMHANNEIGTIQPIREIGDMAKAHNVLFHTDAVQSLTKVPIDTKAINIDLISFSAHKIHGPRGVGALYVKKGTPLQQLFYGGSQEFKKRPGTENVPGIIGFTKALELSKQSDNEKMRDLRDYFIAELLKIPKTALNGSKSERLCNNANIGFEFIEGEGLLMYLNDKGIAVSTGSACSSRSLEPSHVLAAIGLKHEIMHGSIRFTLSKYTTKADLDYTIKQVKSAVKKLRKFSALEEGKVYDAVTCEDDHHHDIEE